MSKRTIVLMVIAVIGIVIAVYGFSGSDIRTVKVASVSRGDIETAIRVTGRVINDKTVTMTALVNGQIEGMLVQKGDTVKADQVLAFFDKREADAELAKAEAVLAREEQSVIEARSKYQRLKNVKGSGGSTQQMIDDAQAELNAAISRANVARAELRVARIHREKIDVRAPFDGVITEKTTEKGQWLEAGTKLFTLVGKQGREIEVKVDAGDSGTVKLGQTVNLTCDAFPGKVWQETIHWIAPSIIQDEANEAVNTFAVRISLGEQAPALLLGQQVDAHIVVASRRDVLLLPFSALHGKPGDYRVAVLNDEKVLFKEVETGIESDTHVEITSGLDEGMQVLLAQGKPLVAGEEVRVKP